MSTYGDRELDVRVARALGWHWIVPAGGLPWLRRISPNSAIDQGPGRRDPETAPLAEFWDSGLPRYSTDPTAYMGLLAGMAERGWRWRLEGGAETGGSFACTLALREIPRPEDYVVGFTPGEAICRAALAALRALA